MQFFHISFFVHKVLGIVRSQIEIQQIFNVQVSSLVWNNLGLGSKIGPTIVVLGVMDPWSLNHGFWGKFWVLCDLICY